MSRPVTGSVADELYESVEPVAFADEQLDWPLLTLCAAAGAMVQEIDDYVRDTDAGPGWSILLDIDRTPSKALGWLAQFVGVSLRDGLDDAGQRDWIRSTDGMARGSLAAITGAAQRYLTGGRAVILRERFDPDDPTVDSPYHLQVITFTAQTPDPVAVEAALTAQKPAGIVLHYDVLDGQDFEQLRSSYSTFDLARIYYTDFEAMRTDHP